jgi:Gpi18-like mannosyltransferase
MKIETTVRDRISAFVRAERETLFAFGVTRLFVWLIALAAVHWLKHGDYKIFPGNAPWLVLYHWDAFWYAKIVAHGYEYIPNAQSSIAFFPLLPLCIHGLRAVTGAGTALAGFLITNSALLAVAIFLRRLVALDFDPLSRIPIRTVWLLLLSPMTFFHSAVYTEAPFLLFSIAAIFFARKQRWLGAGLSGALLTATRANGILILLPLLWEALRSPSSSPKVPSKWWLCLVPLGVAGFALFLYFRFQAPFAFLTAQAAFHREASNPVEGLLTALRYSPPYNLLFAGSAVVAIVLLIYGVVKKLRPSYLIYATAMLILCLSTSIWESLPRYLSAVFPFYIVPAAFRSNRLYFATLGSSAAVMVFCLSLFAAGYFMT